VVNLQANNFYSPAPLTTPVPTPRPYGPTQQTPVQPQFVQPPVQNGTFPYNGGPVNPVPLPGDPPLPTKDPRGTVPLEGKLVSLPRETFGGVGPVVTPEIQKLSYVSLRTSQLTTTPTSYSYPAYGEQPITPAPRKTISR